MSICRSLGTLKLCHQTSHSGRGSVPPLLLGWLLRYLWAQRRMGIEDRALQLASRTIGCPRCGREISTRTPVCPRCEHRLRDKKVTRQRFLAHLQQATAGAIAFAVECTGKDLPNEVRYYIPRPWWREEEPEKYGDLPGDPSDPLYGCFTSEQVIDELWRDGQIPLWVDLCVTMVLGSITIVELSVADRYRGRWDELFHQRTGHPPFQVTGPSGTMYGESIS